MTLSNLHLKALIKESTTQALWESSNVRKVVLEGRLRTINETLELDEAGMLDKARQWLAKKTGHTVDPSQVVDDPKKSLGIIVNSIQTAKKGVAAFKQDALRSSSTINSLQDSVLDAFGKFQNLTDSIPQEHRGVLERELMKVVGQFYVAMMEEKKRIETYLSHLAKEMGSQGYDMGRSAQAMAGHSPAKAPKVQGSRVVEPETSTAPAGALA